MSYADISRTVEEEASSQSTARLVTKEGSAHSFLNCYAQVLFQDDFTVKLPAQGKPVPLKQVLLHILTLYHYASSFLNIRRMRKCKKSFHYFEIAALRGDGRKVLYIL